MNSERSRLYKVYEACTDILALIISYFIANLIRFGELKEFITHLSFFVILIPSYMLAYVFCDIYEAKASKNIFTLFRNVILANGMAAFVVMAVLYITKSSTEYSRIMLALLIFINIVFNFLSKVLYTRLNERLFKTGKVGTRALIIYTSENTETNIANLVKDRVAAYDYVGILAANDMYVGTEIARIKVIGTIDSLKDTLKNEVLDEVIIIVSKFKSLDIDDYVQLCESVGVAVHVVFDLEVKSLQKKLSYKNECMTLSLYNTRLNTAQLFLKRVIDVMGGFVGLLITGVAFLVIAPAIKLESSGPIFFSQMRVGENGRRFKCYKFRSMCTNAEAMQKSLMDKNEMKGNLFKIKDDPRITKVGKILRSTSLDELPQFWNIFKGDMSLVGTRPPTVSEVEKYTLNHKRRLSIKPGLTGMWQVSGRNNIDDFEDVVDFDLKYINNWSLWLDFKIILQTVGAVVKKSGL